MNITATYQVQCDDLAQFQQVGEAVDDAITDPNIAVDVDTRDESLLTVDLTVRIKLVDGVNVPPDPA